MVFHGLVDWFAGVVRTSSLSRSGLCWVKRIQEVVDVALWRHLCEGVLGMKIIHEIERYFKVQMYVHCNYKLDYCRDQEHIRTGG